MQSNDGDQLLSDGPKDRIKGSEMRLGQKERISSHKSELPQLNSIERDVMYIYIYKAVKLLAPFYRAVNGNSERLRNSPDATHHGHARIYSNVKLTLRTKR